MLPSETPVKGLNWQRQDKAGPAWNLADGLELLTLYGLEQLSTHLRPYRVGSWLTMPTRRLSQRWSYIPRSCPSRRTCSTQETSGESVLSAVAYLCGKLTWAACFLACARAVAEIKTLHVAACW